MAINQNARRALALAMAARRGRGKKKGLKGAFRSRIVTSNFPPSNSSPSAPGTKFPEYASNVSGLSKQGVPPLKRGRRKRLIPND